MSTEAIERAMDEAAEPGLIGRRSLLAGIGGLGLVGAIGINRALAQEATPTATDDEDQDDEGPEQEIDREIGEAYDNFVAKLAEQLGDTDAGTVDTAIRNALKAMVDEQFDEGNISRNLATEIKERIDESEAPIATMMFGMAIAAHGPGEIFGIPGGGVFPAEIPAGGPIEGGPNRTIMICADGTEDKPEEP